MSSSYGKLPVVACNPLLCDLLHSLFFLLVQLVRNNFTFFYRCHSYDYGDTGAQVCRLSHHSTSTLMQIEEPYLEAIGATTYELGACYNVTVECKVRKKIAISTKTFIGTLAQIFFRLYGFLF